MNVELVMLEVEAGAVVGIVAGGVGLESFDRGDAFLGSISLFTQERIFSLSILLHI